MDTVPYFNLFALCAFSWYIPLPKTDITKQIVVAYTSTIITFILLVGVIIYHVYCLLVGRRRKDHPQGSEEVDDYRPLAPLVAESVANAEVTHSVVEIPKLHDQSSPPVEPMITD